MPAPPARRRRSPRRSSARAARSDASAAATDAWVGERSASVRVDPMADLARGQLDELVDRRARVAQRGRGDREREEPEDREAVERAVDDAARRTARRRAPRGRTPRRRPQSWLPVPRRPSVCQVSRTSRSCLRSATTLGVGRSPAVSAPSSTKQPANSRSACAIPLQNAQRPETTSPPSTGRALPRGAQTPAAIPRPSPNSSVAALRGQVGGQQAAGDRDRDAPAGRCVPAGDLLRAPQRQAGRELKPSDLQRRTGPQQTGVPQAGDELVGKLPQALRLGGQLSRRRGDLAREPFDLVTTRWGSMQLSLGDRNPRFGAGRNAGSMTDIMGR